MSIKVEILLNDPVVERLKEFKDVNQRAAAVRDVLLSSANELVGQIAQKGLKDGVTITKHVGMTYDGECRQEDPENKEVEKVQ